MRKLTETLNSLKKLGLLIACGFLLSFSNVQATHLVGGELSYQWISANYYQVTLKLYRDCGGIPMVGSYNVNISSSCSNSFSATLLLYGSSQLVSPICSAQISNSTCNGGSLIGVEQYTYSAVVTLPANCSDWLIEFDECCRNAGITNLVNPSGYGMYLSAKLNNQNFSGNNSSRFMSPPLAIIKENDTTSINWSAVDVDGDSLSYALSPAREYYLTPVNIPYVSPLTYDNPLTASAPAIFDSTTGVLTVSPNTTQIAVVAMIVSEYRNGIKIGEVSRDWYVNVQPTTNNLPELSGINGANTFIYTACPGDTINFNIFSYDSDSNQIVTTQWDSAFSGPVLTSNGAPNPTTNFSWVVDSNDISSQPYLLTLKVEDDNCPYMGVQYYTYKIYVRPCNSILVWPGDADLNTSVDIFDFLPIGLAYGTTGPVRTNASIMWTGQSCMDWSQDFVSGVNYKNADCNGDSIIDLNDTTAILLNYHQNHSLRIASAASVNSFGQQPNIHLVANVDTTGVNTTIYYDVVVGDSILPVDSIYGIAFTIQFNLPQVIGAISTTYYNSFMGTMGTNLFNLEKIVPSNGQVDIGLSGIYHFNQSGYGTVARIGVVITDNISGKAKFFPVITGSEGVTSTESYLTFGRICDTIFIDPLFTGVHSVDLNSEISLYPNPATNKVIIESGFNKIENMEIADCLGRIIYKQNYHQQNKVAINVIDFNSGIYYAKIVTDKGSSIKKIIISKPVKN